MAPERTSRWLNLFLPLLERGGPVVSLFLIVIGALIVWWLLGALDHQQQSTRVVYDRLLLCLEQQIKAAHECGDREGRKGVRE